MQRIRRLIIYTEVSVLLEELKEGLRVDGVIPGETVSLIAVQPHGPDAVELTYKNSAGTLDQQIVFRKDEANLSRARGGSRSFDAPAQDFKLAAEAQRIKLAGLFDPMLAVATSDVQPLPHQIRAVYGELLPRTPLRFLLADDPGAGKTIMAGLYIKELILREDVHRCMIVAPGGLVEQWQDELFYKFGLRFELLTNDKVDAQIGRSVFDAYPFLIARMDQLSRNEELQAQLAESHWDLVVVDEAHRMGAHYFGGELKKTKRFQLGEKLDAVARHLLLMTATPHSGKEEDFQLFLTLLDRDRYEGKYNKRVHQTDTSGIMRRMVKEDLLTFEGKPLFTERIAETIPYALSPGETDLYESVTAYVRDGMNRAQKLDGKRRNTVGFALTVLQRRLASSPEAIYQSLLRRSARLEKHKQALVSGVGVIDEQPGLPPPNDYDEYDEYSAAEIEVIEEELVDAATAARTVAELDTELLELAQLIESARAVRASGDDRKWVELRGLLQDHALNGDENERPRKLIIFTEHRDTLDYLHDKISTLIGRPDAVQAIHGGVRRQARWRITKRSTHHRKCQILLATDAAGEGLNLQVAHLMVNYDLPWNPNRIEQRFGRIHRIGQTETCRLWNLVASDTREGAVFTRLLEKIDEQRKAYGGKVFDVLGTAFEEVSLRELLIEAIRYGEQPEVRARMEQVIDDSVADGIQELLEDRALAQDSLAESDLNELRVAMDEARARRLAPHYIESAFREGFTRMGGRMSKREKDRYEIPNVPASLRAATREPVATRYERVTFEITAIEHEDKPRADLLAPGHPLHDIVKAESINRWNHALESGTVLVSAKIEKPKLLVGVIEEVADATGAAVARRFGYAYVDPDGSVSPAGPAPYLDCVAAPDTVIVDQLRELDWLSDAEERAASWIIANQLPQYLAEVRPRRDLELRRTREQVTARLQYETNRLWAEATAAQAAENDGNKVRESSASLSEKATNLERRQAVRLQELSKQELLTTRPPRILTAAVVLPLDMTKPDETAEVPQHAVETKEVERRGVDLVLATEAHLGRTPHEQAFNNPGFDVLSYPGDNELPIRIEVKARILGANDFFITNNEIVTGKNTAPRYRLALVSVDPRGAEHDQVRYLDDPFADIDMGGFDAMGVRADWAKNWKKGEEPF